MKKTLLQVMKYAFVSGLIVFLLEVFIPRTYDVPPILNRKGTLYWDLKTGSKIAYTLVPAKGIKKPYPIIFLQGGPGGFITDRNIKMLEPISEEGFDIYLYDQIGSGLSERLTDITEYTSERHKRDLEEIIIKIGSKKVIIIGQSWGAILATLVIADNPNKVEKVILTGAGPILPMHEELAHIISPDSLKLRKPLYSNAEANEKTKNIRMIATKFWSKTFGKKLIPDEEADAFQTFLNQELNKVTVCDTSKALKAEAGGGFYAHIMTVESFKDIQDIRTKLNGSKLPVLLMKGQCDNQAYGFIKEYLELFPNHQFKIIPDAGHSISVEQPELYLKTIREFLNQ